MKTNASWLAIVTFFTILAAVLFGRAAMANSDSVFSLNSLSLAGMSSKGNGIYEELAELIHQQFGKMHDPFIVLNQGERPAEVFQEDFAKYCMDRDSSDVVSWMRSSDTSQKISFSCVLDGDFSRLRERLFVFTILKGRLVDVQVAMADIAPSGVAGRPLSRNLPPAKPWLVTSEADNMLMSVSGAMVKGGVTASMSSGSFQPKDLTSREAVSGAMVSGLGAAVSHFVFAMAPEQSGLAGGGLTVALADIGDNVPDPFTGLLRRRLERRTDINGGLGPISLVLTFKFW